MKNLDELLWNFHVHLNYAVEVLETKQSIKYLDIKLDMQKLEYKLKDLVKENDENFSHIYIEA